MKLQIDSENKIIKIEEAVNLGELFNYLDGLFPNLEWRNWTLEQTGISTCINSAIVCSPYISPYYPPQNPWVVTCSTD